MTKFATLSLLLPILMMGCSGATTGLADGGEIDGGLDAGASCPDGGESSLLCKPGVTATGSLFGAAAAISSIRLVVEQGCGTTYPDGGVGCAVTGIDVAMSSTDVCVVPTTSDFVSLEFHVFDLSPGPYTLGNKLLAKFAQQVGQGGTILNATTGSVRLDGCDVGAARPHCWGTYSFADDGGEQLQGDFDAAACP